jgi:hypothetical protein
MPPRRAAAAAAASAIHATSVVGRKRKRVEVKRAEPEIFFVRLKTLYLLKNYDEDIAAFDDWQEALITGICQSLQEHARQNSVDVVGWLPDALNEDIEDEVEEGDEKGGMAHNVVRAWTEMTQDGRPRKPILERLDTSLQMCGEGMLEEMLTKLQRNNVQYHVEAIVYKVSQRGTKGAQSS